MSSERQFLLTLTRLLAGTEITQPIVTAPLREEVLLRSATYHQLVPLIDYYRAPLREYFPALSTDFWDKVHIYTLANQGYLLQVEQLLSTLITCLQQQGIAYRLFKGIVLAYQFYPEPSCRTFGDIDLLIQSGDLPRFEKLLFQLDFELCADLYGQLPRSVIQKYHFARHYQQRHEPAIPVDIHQDLTGALHPFQFSIMEFWDKVDSFKCNQQTWSTFKTTYQAIIALYHAFKHYYFKLIWFCDLYLLVRQPAFDRHLFLKLVQKYRLTRLWGYYNYLAGELFSPAVPTRAPRGLAGRLLTVPNLLDGYLKFSPSQARIILPLIYHPDLSVKLHYLWQQLWPPRAVVSAFYGTGAVQPTWYNYLRHRRQALKELFQI